MGRLLVVLFLGSTAHADEDELQSKARAHAEAGRVLYQAGAFRESIREFMTGYELSALPAFLINVGQAYRHLGDLEHAKEMFERFLIEAPGDAPERTMVKKVLEGVNRELGEKREVDPSPPPLIDLPLPSPSPSAEPVIVERKPPAPAKASFARRHWWIFPVVGVAAAGLAVGIYFAARPQPLECKDAMACFTVR